MIIARIVNAAGSLTRFLENNNVDPLGLKRSLPGFANEIVWSGDATALSSVSWT